MYTIIDLDHVHISNFKYFRNNCNTRSLGFRFLESVVKILDGLHFRLYKKVRLIEIKIKYESMRDFAPGYIMFIRSVLIVFVMMTDKFSNRNISYAFGEVCRKMRSSPNIHMQYR